MTKLTVLTMLAGMVLGALIMGSIGASVSLHAHVDELEALRTEVHKLSRALEQTQHAAEPTRAIEAQPAGAPGTEQDALPAPEEPLNAPELATEDAVAEVASEPRDEPALSAVAELIAGASRRRSWGRDDVLAFRERVATLGPRDHAAAVEQLVLAVNQGRLRIAPGLMPLF